MIYKFIIALFLWFTYFWNIDRRKITSDYQCNTVLNRLEKTEWDSSFCLNKYKDYYVQCSPDHL